MSSQEKHKVIQINPDFFSLSKNKTIKKRKEIPKKLNVRNTLKKKLISNIRNFNKNKEKEKTKKPNHDNVVNSNTDRLTEAMSFLDKYLKEKNPVSKRERKHNKSKTKIPEKNTLENKIKVEPTLESHRNEIKNDEFISSKSKPEPPYGCLKGGKKMTYSQYKRSLKKEPHNLHHHTVSREKGKNNKIKIEDNQKIETDRSKKLKELKDIRQKETKDIVKRNHNIISLKNIPKQNVRKYRVKTIRRMYNLGKKNSKVGVFIKNNKTIKQIKKEINILQEIDINTIKRELRDKNLIRYGTRAPDTLIREIYKNTVLSGDVKNKNSNYLIHNYLYQS